MDEERIREEFNKRSKNVTRDDLKKVVESSDELLAKVKSSSLLSRQLAKIKFLVMMIKDYWNGEYREVPWGIIASIVVLLIYILSPIDLIPDFIPGAGYIDDVGLLGLVWKFISSDVEKYCQWREGRSYK
jgi:uncharacterized membrane protein YkvA (DUF1232 family)